MAYSDYTQKMLDQMSSAGDPRTTTTETTQEQPAQPIDMGSLAMVLAMLLGKSQPSMIGEISEPTLPLNYSAPMGLSGGAPAAIPGLSAGFNLAPAAAANAFSSQFSLPAQGSPWGGMTPQDILGEIGNTPIGGSRSMPFLR